MKVVDTKLITDLKEYHIFDFGEIYFFKNHIIAEFFEGIDLNINDINKVLQLIRNHYPNLTRVAYISNRVNSYFIKPTDWLKITRQLHDLNSICIVYHKVFIQKMFLIEKMFSKVPMYSFADLDSAIIWSSERMHIPLLKEKA